MIQNIYEVVGKLFALIIRIFNRKTIGVIVLNKENDKNKHRELITTSWILDGCRRRTTLINETEEVNYNAFLKDL